MKVVIIGGGPAGMMAAISAKKSGDDVVLIEKMNTLGKKLAITGKGRCNITSNLDISEFINNIPGNGRFLYSAFQNFNNRDIIDLLQIPTKVERGNRIFPTSDKAEDVIKALKNKLNGVTIYTNTNVEKLIVKDEKIVGVVTDKGEFDAEKVIIATGGMSYPTTGSTGDGYKLAQSVGHTITEIRPSLVALTSAKSTLSICQALQGLSLK